VLLLAEVDIGEECTFLERRADPKDAFDTAWPPGGKNVGSEDDPGEGSGKVKAPDAFSVALRPF